MTIDEAAIYVGVPVPTLHKWVWAGIGPVHTGTRWRPEFTGSDLETWLDGAKDRVNKGFNGWPVGSTSGGGLL